MQYLGVAQDEESGLPILLMELMDDSLTHFLEQSQEPLAYHVQVNISHDIALAVAFLHLNCIVHGDLSSSNVLLIGAGNRAKVTDFGMSTLTELNPHMRGLTKCPGNPAYMSPEALLDPPVYTEKLDCFQVGVLMLQIMTRKYPVPGRAMNRVRDARSLTGWKIVPVPELQRRYNHLSLVVETHPMLHLSKDCLKDTDTERPSGQEICRRLSALKQAPQYVQSLGRRGGEREGGERVEEGGRERQEREREAQEREELIRQLREENQLREREVREKEREVENIRGEVRVKQGEIENLSGVIREREREVRENEREREVREREREREVRDRLREVREMEVREKNEEIQDLRRLIADKDQTIHQLQETQQFTSTYTCHTAVRRGPHKLHVRVNGSEINGSPFTVTMYPDPTQLGSPVRVVKHISSPYGIACNSHGEIIVTESNGHQVSVFDVGGRKIRTFHCRGDRPEQMMYPAGVAVDDTDNIYVSSQHKLQKFTSSGELIKCIGRRGSKEEEFDDPRGVTIHSNQVYVCDRGNHRIQVFDLDLNYIRSIGSRGMGRGELDRPSDVAFDTAGKMYVVEWSNNRVQVMDSNGQFIRMFGQEGEGKLSGPTALHIADKYVYVSDCDNHCIAVYETSGQYVTSFGMRGEGEGEFRFPFCITSCVSGCIYVCDRYNDRVQVF